MNNASNILYEFGPFRLDPGRELVLRDSQPLAITPKAFEVLLVLVRRNHEVVSKDELMQAVWSGRVVEEANLTQCIFVLRKLLGDTYGERRYIVTLPGQGYRFAEQVRVVTRDESESPQGLPAAADAAMEPPAESNARSNVRKWALAVIGMLIVAMALAAAVYFIRHRAQPAVASTYAAVSIDAHPVPAKSIAVLPFENLSDDKKNEYFVAGIQDLILTKLADIGGLKVISRTATEQYTSRPSDLDAIGQRLGVATFLEGSVQKAGKQVLITVQLIDAKTNNHIWAQSYQRDLTNIFGVEGEVAGKVADALNATLTASESTAVAHVPTTNPQAYDDYLRGLHFDNEADKGDWTRYLPQAIAAYEKAVAEDPDFALAWAALSNAHGNLFFWAGDRSQANLLAADTAARRALQLDPELPDAHLAMAGVERFLRHDLVATHDQAQRAVELRPNDADALASLAIADSNLGIAGGGKLIQRAIALDPTEPFNYFFEGEELAASGDYSGARQAERRALAINPQFALAYLVLSQIEISDNQDVEAATQILDRMAPGTPVNARLVSWRIDLLLFRRQFDAARALAEKQAGKFAGGPGAAELAFTRANIEWLAGNTSDARALYRTAIGLATRPGSEISEYDHALLGLVHARLGDAKPALQESDEALATAVKSHKHDLPQGIKYVRAETQLALGNQSAAIDTLAEVLSMDPHDIRAPWLLFLPRMQLDPVWDPIRNDPRFRALLKKYAQPAPASRSAVGSAAPSST
jgi:TolB-like protein/DNA-binding winged helix-turn-helix (wHTH) protein